MQSWITFLSLIVAGMFLFCMLAFFNAGCSRATGAGITDVVDNNFHICLSGYTNGWVQIYEYDPASPSFPTAPMLTRVGNDSCAQVTVPDGTILVAYFCMYKPIFGANIRRNTAIAYAGEHWQLNYVN